MSEKIMIDDDSIISLRIPKIRRKPSQLTEAAVCLSYLKNTL